MGKIWATSLLEKILETHPLSALPHPPSPLYKAEGGEGSNYEILPSH